jgi:glucose dehydrogenase
MPVEEREMRTVIALLAVLSLAGSAHAGCPKEWTVSAPQQRNLLRNFAASQNPQVYEQQRRDEAARATYSALLQAGATEEIACAAALNSDFFQLVAPQYLQPRH